MVKPIDLSNFRVVYTGNADIERNYINDILHAIVAQLSTIEKSVGITDAPIDGNLYGRKNGEWSRVSQSSGGVSSIIGTSPIDVDLSTPSAPVISHDVSGVVAGSYTNADITVDAEGHITAASNGSGGGGGVIIYGTPPSNTVTNSFSFTPSFSGFTTGVHSIFSGAVPGGTSLNTTTGEVSGVTTTPGAYSYTQRVVATDGSYVGAVAMCQVDGTVTALTTVTWNPSDKDSSVVLSVANTVAQFPTADRNVRGNIGHSSGKYYFRLRTTAGTIAASCAGVANASASLTARPGLSDANSWAHQSNANKLHSGYSFYGQVWDGVGDELMVAVDFTLGYIWFGKNGTWMASGDPVAGTNPSFTGVSGTLYPIGNSPSVPGSGITLTFVYDTPPSGYIYW